MRMVLRWRILEYFFVLQWPGAIFWRGGQCGNFRILGGISDPLESLTHFLYRTVSLGSISPHRLRLPAFCNFYRAKHHLLSILIFCHVGF